MKQTAIDWLVKEFNLESYKATIALVKEMEKQQIIYAFNLGQQKESKQEFWTKGEEYYNETYENKENI